MAGQKASLIAGLSLVVFFALFHGHAHGTEMPVLAEPGLYALGFMLGTASIHLCGAFGGLIALQFRQGPQMLRYVGAGIAGAGLHMLM